MIQVNIWYLAIPLMFFLVDLFLYGLSNTSLNYFPLIGYILWVEQIKEYFENRKPNHDS